MKTITLANNTYEMNEKTDKWIKFNTMEEAEKYRNENLSQWFQVVILPKIERGKQIYKVICNMKLI